MSEVNIIEGSVVVVKEVCHYFLNLFQLELGLRSSQEFPEGTIRCWHTRQSLLVTEGLAAD